MREFYLHVKRDKKGKKILNFGGKHWGDMSIEDANARAIRTGDGLCVIDIDTKDLSSIDPKLVSLLPDTPTVETENGYHYYLKGKGVPQTQALVDKVDIRNEGGFVFDQYFGNGKGFKYKKRGKPVKPSPELLKYLKELSNSREKRTIDTIKLNYVPGKPWKKFKDGEQHIMLRATMQRMFDDGATVDEVWSRAEDYIKTHLKDTPHERRLMRGRMDWVAPRFEKQLKGKRLELKKAPKLEKMKSKKKQKKFEALSGIDKLELLLSEAKLTKEKAEARANQRMLVPHLIAHRMHLFLYGASGSFKTTVMSSLAINMAKEGMRVHYWAFDPSHGQQAALERLTREREVDDKLKVYADAGIDLFKETYADAIEEAYDLSQLVIILDTYKFFTADVNNKTANKEALHFVKQLQGLGVTFISIGHTNKDGKDRSGTAETEQDTDAVMRVDAILDEVSKTATVTISKKDHRVRYGCRDVSFEIDITPSKRYAYKSLKSVKVMDQAVDVDRHKQESEIVEKNREKLSAFCQAIYENGGSISMGDLRSYLSESYPNKTTVVRFIESFEGRAWDSETEAIHRDGLPPVKNKVITLNNAYVIKHNIEVQ